MRRLEVPPGRFIVIERTGAFGAAVRLQVRMGDHVALGVRLALEVLVAQEAVELACAVDELHVGFEAALGSKALFTDFTLERAFASVDCSVLQEPKFVEKSLVTKLALEWPFP